MKKTLFRLAGRVAVGLLAVTLVCGVLSCDNDSGKDDNDVVYAPGSSDGTGSSGGSTHSSGKHGAHVSTRIWACLHGMGANKSSSHLSFKPSATARPASATTYYTFKDCSPAVEVIGWKEGNTIWYYAAGYTDSGRRIPLAADSSGMFRQCEGLSSIDLSGFDTSNVTNMEGMFCYCSGLTSLDLSGFDTSNVTNMGSMFADCSGLISLNLSSFNTGNVTDMGLMFYSCSSLTTIFASSGFVPCSTSWGTFEGCSSLVGGAHTSYASLETAYNEALALGTAASAINPSSSELAHIDGGSSNPGYFTANP